MIRTAVLIALATLVTSSPQERGWSILLLIDVTASVSDAMATVEGAPVPLPRPDGTGPYEVAPRPKAVKRPNSPRDLFLEPVVEGVIRRLGPKDRLRIGRVTRTTTLAPAFSAEPDELVRAAEWALDVDDVDRYGPTPLWDAVDAGVEALEAEGGRRALILVTDGMATGNRLPLDAAIAHAVRAQVIVSVLGETWGQRPRVAFRRTTGWHAGDDTGSPWRVVRWPFGNAPDTNLRKLAISTGGIFAADGEAARDPTPRAAFMRILEHLQRTLISGTTGATGTTGPRNHLSLVIFLCLMSRGETKQTMRRRNIPPARERGTRVLERAGGARSGGRASRGRRPSPSEPRRVRSASRSWR